MELDVGRSIGSRTIRQSIETKTSRSGREEMLGNFLPFSNELLERLLNRFVLLFFWGAKTENFHAACAKIFSPFATSILWSFS